jgi:TRAP-type C4-dicarboxylate transport system substrate-binding protein
MLKGISVRHKLSTLLLGFALATSVSVSAQTKWVLPSAYPVSNFHTENLSQFVKDVNVVTQGQLVITMHPDASLYKAPEIKGAVQANKAQVGEILLAAYAEEDPVFAVDGIPFLATGFDGARKLYEAQKPLLEKKLAEQGMMLLYAVPWPPQGIYTDRELNTVADMKGLKWRAYSPATRRIAELLGADPVTVQAAELAQAMSKGLVNAFMSSSSTGYDTKAWEYVNRFYDTQAWLPKNALIMNKGAFDALGKSTQAEVLKAAAQAEVRGWKISEEKMIFYINALAKNGMKIEQPSAQLTEGLNQVGKKILVDWLNKSGPDGKVLIDAYAK